MGAVETSYSVVENHLEQLGETYQSFAINQTTVAVATDRYEREKATSDPEVIEVYTRVHNDDSEILHVNDGDALELPRATTASVTDVEATARQAVEDAAGIECILEGLDAVTIIGVRDANDDSRPTVYRLIAVFDAVVADDTAATDVEWEQGFERDRLIA